MNNNNQDNNKQSTAGTNIVKAGSIEDITRLAKSEGVELAKMTVAVHLSSSTETLEEALAEFYRYGSQIPFLYSDGSIATALKEIYNQYNETVNERIPGVTGVNSVNAYLIRYMTESLPSLCENGCISQRLIDDLVAPHGIISYMLKELFANHLKTIEKINDTFLVRAQLPYADKKRIEEEKANVIQSYQDEFDKHIEKIKQIFLSSDAQFIYTTLLNVSQKLSSGELDLSFSGKTEEANPQEGYPHNSEEISSLFEGQAMAIEKVQEKVEEIERRMSEKIDNAFSTAASSAVGENKHTEERVLDYDLEALKSAQEEMFSKMNAVMERVSAQEIQPHNALAREEYSIVKEMKLEISSLREQINNMSTTMGEMMMSVQEEISKSVSVPSQQEHLSSGNASEEVRALLEEIKEKIGNNTLTLSEVYQMISDEVAESQRVREQVTGARHTEFSPAENNDNTEVARSDDTPTTI